MAGRAVGKIGERAPAGGLPRPHLKPIVHRGLFRYRLLTAPLRLLPDFIIIGVQKCGTTSLYNYLTGHPSIAPAVRKEVHFFDIDANFQRGPAWYRAHFPSRLSQLYATHARRRKLVTGESTPYYIFNPLVPERVFGTVPAVKLIAVLRNPVDRAYSQYHHQLSVGGETKSFEDVIAHERSLNGRREELFHEDRYSFKHYSYLARGIYMDQLQAWARYFPTEQMLVVKSEDLAAQPQQTLNGVFEFLELPPWQPRGLRQDHKRTYDRMDAGTRRWLAEFFKPHNQRLYEYLGVDFGWDG